MQRAITIALSLAAVALSAVLAFRSVPEKLAPAPTPSASASASPPAPRDAGTPAPDAAPPAEAETAPVVPEVGTAGGPRHIRFGVVLVTYEGAEGADKGARRKSDALDLATKLADQAKGDFHATVLRGDTGSADDLGRIGRGDLEPASEAALFALPVGGVSGVIDTPRGFWIAKRIE
jgi:hypothetical protein